MPGQPLNSSSAALARVLAAVALTTVLCTGCGQAGYPAVVTTPPTPPTAPPTAPPTPTPTPAPPPPPGTPPPAATPTPPATPGAITVAAGALPIAGATVQIYAAGTAGNGSQPAALLSVPLTTSSAGTVPLPVGGVTCPSAQTQIYVYAKGGTVNGAPSPNAAITLLTAIGNCASLTASSAVVVDEVTTAAALYALEPFYAVGGAVGASATNLTGLANAFATAAELVNPATGTAPGLTLPANAVEDDAIYAIQSAILRVNTVANVLNLCTAQAGLCPTVFAALGGSATNTADGAYRLAANPAANPATLFNLATSHPVYAPALAAQPSDFSLFLTFSGGGMSTPTGLGLDSQGNVWVASYFYAASKFSPIGVPILPNGTTGGPLINSYGLAVDTSDNAWIPSEQPYTGQGTGNVAVLNPAGTITAAYTAGGMSYPISVAIDPNGTTWVVDYGDSHLTLLNSSGAPLSGPNGYTTPLFAFPVVVAVDGHHYGWVGNQADVTVTKVAPDGSSAQNFDCCSGASGIAIDQQNNVWVANYYGDSVSMISNAGVVVSNGQYTANGSVDHPQGIAVDGSGKVWVANYRARYLTELAGANAAVPGAPLSPAATTTSGLGGDAGLLEAYALAVDASGDVWVTNQGSNTITKFVGLATPVKTPLSGLPQLP